MRSWPTSARGLGYSDWYRIVNIGGFEAVYGNAVLFGANFDYEVLVGSFDYFKGSTHGSWRGDFLNSLRTKTNFASFKLIGTLVLNCP